MLRRVWVTWAAVALGTLAGCGGDGTSTGSTGTTTTTATTSTTSTGGTGGGVAHGCGDGVVDSGESCDDGNTKDGDGCSKDCAIEKGYACTGAPSACATTCGDGIIAGAEGCDDGNATDGDGCSKDCAIEKGYSCSGEPSACAAGCGDGVIAGAEACDDGNMADGDGCTAACAVEPGWACDKAPTICVEVHGDGIVVGAEECDDNNPDNGDGCSADGKIEPGWYCSGVPSKCETHCGDSIIAGAEACDDGGSDDGDGCSATCGLEPGWSCDGAPSICATTCGDGIIAGVETCDDGNTKDGDGCDAACAVVESGWSCDGSPSLCTAICGDGVITGPEACDDGNTFAGDGCGATCEIEAGWSCSDAPSACVTHCGDGIIAGAEQCDDGNAKGGDGCDAACAVVEQGWSCSGAPSACVTHCGDGIVAGAEQCDDTNTVGGDGCGATCAIESGFYCSGAPSICATVCGDGIQAGTEACDDGNLGSGDGCSSTCKVESGYGCSGAPSVCGPVCGDGIKLPSEKCDDGNLKDGDCCSSTCQIEAGCEIEGNDTAATANDFAALSSSNKIKGFINPTTDKDLFLVVVPPGKTGTITAETLDGPLGTTCAGNKLDSKITVYASNGTTSLGTDDDNGPGACSIVTVGGLAPGNYYVEVKRGTGGNATFDYTLQITLGLADCGNGILEPGEQCDDGNTSNNDGCSSLCKLEPTPEVEVNNSCGAAANGPFTLPPNRLISGSIGVAGDQDWYKFVLTNYADLRVQTFDENGPGTCASGHDTELQAFNSSCVALGALNDDSGISPCSLLDPTSSSQAFMKHLPPGTYYIKVNAHTATATFPYTLLVSTVALCGNGIKEGSEQCDGTAFCAADCRIIPACGNGVVESGEACDDGNNVSGDGCSSTCTVEPNALCAGTAPTVCTTCGVLLQLSATDVPKAIPDNTAAGINSVIPVAASGVVKKVILNVNITHPFDADIDMSLISPAGTTLDISSDNGSTSANYTNTTFDDACTTSIASGSAPFTGCYKPETALSTLNGQAAAGNWTLNVADDSSLDTGSLKSWSLTLCVQ